MLSEDLGTGYCHSHGLGWMGETVAPDDIVGQLEEVEEVGGNGSTTSTINIYWPRLVLRPACVDTLIISTQGKTYHIIIIRSNSDGDVFLTYVYQVFSYINRKLHQKCNIHTTYLSRSEDWDITTNNY